MASTIELKARLEMKKEQLKSAYEAYSALLKGGVKSYVIGSRNLTKFDLPQLEESITKLEKELDVIENQIKGRGARKAVGVVPIDY